MASSIKTFLFSASERVFPEALKEKQNYAKTSVILFRQKLKDLGGQEFPSNIPKDQIIDALEMACKKRSTRSASNLQQHRRQQY